MLQMSIKKWGNSPATRLPADLMQAANLKINDVVNVTDIQVREDGKILLELTPANPVIKKKTYSFKELMSQVTPENTHASVDWGTPQGNEVL